MLVVTSPVVWLELPFFPLVVPQRGEVIKASVERKYQNIMFLFF